MKRFILPCIFASLMIFGVFADLGMSASEKDLAAYWTFDEGSGDTAKDSTKNKNDGKLISNPKWVNGTKGKALEFNGTNYVQIPQNKSLDIRQQITLEAWIKLKDISNSADNDIIINTESIPWEIAVASQCTNAPGIPDYNLSFYINVPNKPGHCSGWIDGKIQVPKGEWAHVAVTYDGKQFQTFVNGKLGTTYPASGEIQALQNHVRIAARGTGGTADAAFNGIIDEVKVWTIGLTEKEVIQSMESGKAVQPDGKLTLTWGLIKI